MEADESLLSALQHLDSDDESSVLSDSSALSESSGISEETPSASLEDLGKPEPLVKQHGAVSSPKFRGTWHPQLPQPRARDLSLYARPPAPESTIKYQNTPPRKHSYTPSKPNANFAELSAKETTEAPKQTEEETPKTPVSRGHSYNPFDENANFTGYQGSKKTEPRVQSWEKTGKDGYPIVADRLNYQGQHSFVPPSAPAQDPAPTLPERTEAASRAAKELNAPRKRLGVVETSEVKTPQETEKMPDEKTNDEYSFESKSQLSSPPHTSRSGGSVTGELSNSGQASPFDRDSLLAKDRLLQGFQDLEGVLQSMSLKSEDASHTLGSEDEQFELLDLDMKHEQTTKVKLLTSTYSGTVRAGGKQDSLRCLLEALGIEFEEIDGALTFLPEVVEERNRLFGISGIRGNYPQLFVNDCFVGLFEDVQDLNEIGQLKDILRYGPLEEEVVNSYS